MVDLGIIDEALVAIRQYAQRQHALGSSKFQDAIEAQLARRARPAKIGRPPKPPAPTRPCGRESAL